MDSWQAYFDARRQLEEDRRQVERITRMVELNQQAIQAAITLACDQIAAPWRALAEELRRR